MELYLKYRPRKLKYVLGQDEAIESLGRMHKKGKVPHAALLSGPSGCGKTTVARIEAKMLNCHSTGIREINSADFRGIDTIRDIRSNMHLAPMGGDVLFWIIDEAHAMTKQAQEALLKVLEDTPQHCYFRLCTTDPAKLIHAVRTRCTDIKFRLLKGQEIGNLIKGILKQEKRKIDDDVKDKIIEVSEGSARKALVLLHQVLDMKKKKQQLQVIEDSDSQKEAIEIARALVSGKSWTEIAKIVKNVKEDPESIRRMVLGYASAIALNKPNPGRELALIDCFSQNYFDTGRAGLIWSCNQFVLLNQRKKR